MRQLSQGVNLVHELGELAATKEVAHNSAQSLGIDKLAGSDVVAGRIAKSHALLDQALGAGQAHAALVGNQFAHSTHAAVAKVVDIIHLPFTIAQAKEVLEGAQEVDGRSINAVKSDWRTSSTPSNASS